MANFKGGFAFNNGPAKAEVEQAPDGTLISCVNPVTGESLNAGNYSEIITGTAADIFHTNNYDTTVLASGLLDGSISALATVDCTALGKGTYTIPLTSREILSSPVIMGMYTELEAVDPFAVEAYWYWTEDTSARGMWSYDQNGIVPLTDYMSLLPASITIYHHPMPE